LQNGLIHVYCGDGKGKTTCAAGLCLRAKGRGKASLWTSFTKNYDSGEFLGDMPFILFKGEPVEGFIKDKSEEEFEKISSEHTLRLSQVFQKAVNEEFDLLILDEVLTAAELGLVEVGALCTMLQNKSPSLEVVLTGRSAPGEILYLADYVSEIRAVKHPFEKGILGREGIEK